MFRPNKPASPFGDLPQNNGQNSGQYGANANPSGHARGQQFMQQYGAPPGQMKDEWAAYKAQNGFGQPQQGMAPQMPQQPQMPQPQAPNMMQSMQAWQSLRPQMSGQPMDRMAMLRAWLAQRPRGLLGG